MRVSSRFSRIAAGAILGAAVLARAARVDAQAPPAVRQALSREVSLANTFTPPQGDAPMLQTVSREVTLANTFVPPEGAAPVRQAVSREITVAFPVSDLAAVKVSAMPPEGLPARPYIAVWRTKNVGPVSAVGPWVDRVYLSADLKPGNDTLLGEVAYGENELTPGSSYERSVSASFPIAPGQYWLIVETGVGSVLGETNGLNNVLVSDVPIRVVKPQEPDLVVSDVVSPQGTALAGSTTEISFIVSNASANPTYVPAWTDSVFLVRSPALEPSLHAEPFFLGEFESPIVLLPLESYSQTVRVTLPSKTEGIFQVAVYADSRRGGAWRLGDPFDQPESIENNNWLFSAPFEMRVSTIQPDLRPTAISFLPEASSSRVFELGWRDENIGSAATETGSWQDAAYLSVDANASVSPGDILLGRRVRGGPPVAPGGSTELELDTPLPADLAGGYRVKIATDIADSVCEYGHEQNNVAVSPQPLTIFQSPSVDLAPVDVKAPALGYPGHSLEVSWSVRNVGAPPLDLALSWQDAVYLSRDGEWNPAEDLLLGRFARTSSRDAGGHVVLDDYSRTASIRMPAGTPAGTHHLIVVTDSLDTVFEGRDAPGPADDALKERNNALASAPIDIQLLSTDLVAEMDFDAAHRIPTSGAPGQALTISWRVRNAGAIATPAGYWSDSVYFSTDDVLGPGDRLLATAAHSDDVPAGASYIAERPITVPGIAAGDYFLLLVADVHDQVLELSPGEDNNVTAAPFAVTADGPDLAITEVHTPSSAQAGGTVRVTWTGANRGTRPTGFELWSDRVYLSADEILDPGDVLLGATSHGGPLDTNATYASAATLDVPPTAGGLLHVIVQADAGDDVFEIDEVHNAFAQASLLDVRPLLAPNLVVRSVSVDGAITSGQTIQVRWTVENAGNGPTLSASWNDAVFLSRDRFLDAHFDLFLESTAHVGALLPSANYAASGLFDVPPGVSGAFYVFVVADRGSSGFDSVVLDNQASTGNPLDVALPLPSDLAVVDVLPPAAGVTGAPGRFEWRIANVGGADVGGRWTDALFLSRDSTFGVDDYLLGSFPSHPPAPLAAGTSALFVATAMLPNVPPGPYRVLVRADALNQVPDAVAANDMGASAGTIEITVPRLVLDQAPIEIRLPAGEDRLFELETPALEAVRITVEHSNLDSWTELYARFEAVPTPGQFDIRFEAVGEPAQTITIPDTKAGKYYVLARAARGTFSPGGDGATIVARTVPFAVDSSSPRAVGDVGRVTLTVRGSRFAQTGGVFLEGGGAARRAAHHVEWVDASLLRATFELDGISRGARDLVVTRPEGTEARLAAAVLVQPVVPPVLEIADPAPPALREGASAGTLEVSVVNRGNVDAEYVFAAAVLEARPGVELLQARSSSPFSKSIERDGSIQGSAIVRSLAPGSTARLWVTARAGRDAGGALDVGVGGLLLDTRGFLRFADDVAEALRAAILADPGIAGEPPAVSLLEAAQGADAWRALWREKLVAARLLAAADKDATGTSAQPVRGQASCAARPDPSRESADFCRDETLLCSAWLEGLLAEGASTLGGLARIPRERLGGLRCDPAAIVGCSFCTSWAVKQSIDPNEKTGSEGTGDEGFVPKEKPLKYRIYFENLSSATGPAALVRITDPLDPALNASSVRFGDIAFGGTIVNLPEDTIFFQERRSLDSDPGLALDIVAGVDALRNEVFWILRTIDRETGLVPTDAARGFLSVSDGAGAGLGWVEFTVAPTPSTEGKIVIRNEACIVFDSNEPLETKPVEHTVDPSSPASNVAPLPSLSDGPAVPLAWSGADDLEGSGIASFTIQVSRDGGPFAPFLANTRLTSASFPAEPGHHYAFYSTARDHAGNEERPPVRPDAETTTTGGNDPFRRGDTNGDALINITDAIFHLNHLFLGGLEPPCADATDANDDARSDISDGVFILRYLFVGGTTPPAPGPRTCGPDPTPDSLGPCRDPGGACGL